MKKVLLLSASLMLMICSSIGLIQAQDQTFSKPIDSSADDAEEAKAGTVFDQGAAFYWTSSDLELDMDLDFGPQWVGLRFTGITIPKNATITEAKIQFTAKYVSSGACTVTVEINNADNAAAFVEETVGTPLHQISGRAPTTDAVTWNVPDWLTVDEAAAPELTPDLKVLLQKVVNRSGWASGNAVCFMIQGPGSGSRGARSYDASSSHATAPVLNVKYNTATAITDVTDLRKTQVEVYPNPVEGNNFRVRLAGFNNGSIVKLTLFDISGKEIYSKNIDTQTDVEIPTRSYSQGIYFVKAQSANQVATSRFVKK